jgi:hypothetical protein
MSGTLLSATGKVTRQDLRGLPVPVATGSHQPVPHWQLVDALLETLGFRHIQVTRDEYAVSLDGMKMFGVLDLEYGITGVNFSIGVRNANDKSMRLAMTVGYRVLVCDNMAFYGDFTPLLKKHTKNFDLIEAVSVGVDKIQRNFEPLSRQITCWQRRGLTDDQARLILYEAFVEGGLQAPRNLLPVVHRQYFRPEHEEFRERTLWSLSNAFTSAFKQLNPVRQFQATAKLGVFLAESRQARDL